MLEQQLIQSSLVRSYPRDMRRPALGDIADLSELIQLGAGGPQ